MYNNCICLQLSWLLIIKRKVTLKPCGGRGVYIYLCLFIRKYYGSNGVGFWAHSTYSKILNYLVDWNVSEWRVVPYSDAFQFLRFGKKCINTLLEILSYEDLDKRMWWMRFFIIFNENLFSCLCESTPS